MFLVGRSEYICTYNMYFKFANTRRFSPVAVQHIKHRPVVVYSTGTCRLTVLSILKESTTSSIEISKSYRDCSTAGENERLTWSETVIWFGIGISCYVYLP